MDKIKLALIGIYYPCAMLRYFERALERRDDIELVTAGPYTGTYIPWNSGMTVLPKYAKPPTHVLPPDFIRNGKIPANILTVNEKFQDVDLWLEVDAGFYLDPKPTSGIVAHVATDPHALNYDRQRQLADFFFNMQTPYQQSGDIYLPYAYDKDVHYPEDLEKEYDVCMVGLHYPQRDQLVSRLVAEGLNVHYSIGSIFDEYREIYNKSRVGINWSSKLDMNARVWELAAMGIPAVQNTVPDMKTFFVAGDHYAEFTDLESAVDQVTWAIQYEQGWAKDMADAAYRKVQPHTYDARVAQILDRVGLRKAD